VLQYRGCFMIAESQMSNKMFQ